MARILMRSCRVTELAPRMSATAEQHEMVRCKRLDRLNRDPAEDGVVDQFLEWHGRLGVQALNPVARALDWLPDVQLV